MNRPLQERPSDTAGRPAPVDRGRAGLAIAVFLLAFPLSVLLGDDHGLWLPSLGVGIAILSWTSWWVLPLLAVEVLACRLPLAVDSRAAIAESVLLAGQIGASWWVYHRLAKGSRWLEDPLSGMLFLVIVPGMVAALFALAQAGLAETLHYFPEPFGPLFARLWMNRILGVLVPLPALLVLVTPGLVRRRIIDVPTPVNTLANPWQRWSTGELVEVTGLALSSAVLVVILLDLQLPPGLLPWSLWGVGLLIVVWSAVRQGVRGSSMVIATTGVVALSVAPWLALEQADAGQLQGYLLAQGSTALLVGVSAGWIQASEARYRHIFTEIPLVLYSARLPLPQNVRRPTGSRRDSRPDLAGPAVSHEAAILLVSPASQQVFGRSPAELTGPYQHWLSCIVPEDRELVVAALEQLGRQTEPVVCEYRLLPPQAGSSPTGSDTSVVRWVRDSLSPHYADDGSLDGWEGFVEDITERRKLAYDLRRSTAMLQALVANLPAGIFFIHGPMGFTLLANARARELLGQREDGSVPLSHVSRVYRFHRPDGSEYPADELPVAKALRQGVRCSANDVVIHRPDGRKIPLITWAAPVQLSEDGKLDAAVWVLEDLTPIQKAQSAQRESEAILRTVLETMAEAVLVQDGAGVVIECNPAACKILGIPQYQLLGRTSFAPSTGLLSEDGQPLAADDSPDLRALRSGQPVRAVVGIVPAAQEAPRWLLVDALPLPAVSTFTGIPRRGRLVTTITDLTSHTPTPRDESSAPAGREQVQDTA